VAAAVAEVDGGGGDEDEHGDDGGEERDHGRADLILAGAGPGRRVAVLRAGRRERGREDGRREQRAVAAVARRRWHPACAD
jgi:hypothetical protein